MIILLAYNLFSVRMSIKNWGILKALLNIAAVIGADAIGAAAGAAIGVGVAAITAGVTAPVVVPGMAVAVASAASGVVAKDPPVK